MEKKNVFKVLVVDNSPGLLDKTIIALKDTGFQTFSASNGAECIEVLHNERPYLILLDEILPDINGSDLIRKIKDDPEFSSVHIILFFSSKTSSDNISDRLEEGADGYIIRPVSNRELLARVEAAKRIITAGRALKACIDSPKDMIVLAIDLQYNYLAFNNYHKNVMLKAYGTNVKVGMNLLKCMKGEEDIKKAKANYYRAMKGESHVTIEKYGEIDRQYYETRYNPVYNENNEITGATAFSFSVTERVMMHDSLIENELLLKESQAVARLGSFVWNLPSGLWRNSDILDNIFGIDENYIRSFEGWINLVHPDWQDIMTDYVLKEVLGKHKRFDKEYEIIRQTDREKRWVHELAELKLDDNNQPLNLIGTISDITDRRLTEDALKISESVYKKMVENSPLGMHFYELSEEGKLIFISANRAADKILNTDNSQFIGKTIQEAFPPLNQTEVPQRYSEVAEKGIVWSTEQITYSDDNISGAFEVKAFQTNPRKMVAVFSDITRRKLAEEQIKKLNVELEQRVNERTAQLEDANKELQAFAYSVSHDLRAPLRAIDGFSKFLLENSGKKLDPEGKRLLDMIRTNTQKMDHLIVDILALSRVSRSELNISGIDMTSMAVSMLNEVASAEIQKKIDIFIDTLPEAKGDPTYLKLVWVNIISNAIKFSSHKKRPKIEIRGYSENDSNVYFVKDNGVGFDPRYADKLFGAFQRLHNNDEFEGTGVGLAIVQRIIQRHGGKVWAEGKVGKGAKIYFSIPVKKPNFET